MNYPGEQIKPLTKRKHSEVRKATKEKIEQLEEAGYKVRCIYECQWKELKKQPQISAFLKTLRYSKPRRQLSKEKILNGIRTGELYGFVFVDVFTPENLKEKFEDFPLVYKNVEISRDDIGPYMKSIAEQHGYLKKPRKYLINSHFGIDVLINTNMCKFYLEMGLEIRKIHEFVQFHPVKCFENLGMEIANARREADQDEQKQVIALTKIIFR